MVEDVRQVGAVFRLIGIVRGEFFGEGEGLPVRLPRPRELIQLSVNTPRTVVCAAQLVLNLRVIAVLLGEEKFLYMLLYAAMILFFSYFWVATQFNEVQIADDLKKYGGYIPGVRPGQATSQYLHNAMSRITLAGAFFLTIIATVPVLLYRIMGVPYAVATFFGGTSLLILVGVMLDTMRQMESHLLMRHYDGFLKKGKIRGRF